MWQSYESTLGQLHIQGPLIAPPGPFFFDPTFHEKKKSEKPAQPSGKKLRFLRYPDFNFQTSLEGHIHEFFSRNRCFSDEFQKDDGHPSGRCRQTKPPSCERKQT
jgi:hypothetical protein